MENNIAVLHPKDHNFRDPLDIEIEAAVKEWAEDFAARNDQASRVKVTNDDEATRAATLCGCLADITKGADKARETLKAPYLAGGKKIDAAFKPLIEDSETVRKGILRKINTYRVEQQAIADAAAAALAREAAEKAAAAAAAANAGDLVAAAKLEQQAETVATQAVETASAPVIRSAFGSKASGRVDWKHETINRLQLPASILNHPKVIEAQEAVIATLVRTGTREIPGVRIYSVTTTVIR